MFSPEPPASNPQRIGLRTWPLLASPQILTVADRRKLPRVRESDPIVEMLGRVQRTDATYAAKVARVRRYQARLRSELSSRAWLLYLKLEEAEVDRWGYALDRVATWASRKRVRGR
jgi:hypothetical protein